MNIQMKKQWEGWRTRSQRESYRGDTRRGKKGVEERRERHVPKKDDKRKKKKMDPKSNT